MLKLKYHVQVISKCLFFYSHKKYHSLPGISEKVHITAKFEKTGFGKYVGSRVSAFSIICVFI